MIPILIAAAMAVAVTTKFVCELNGTNRRTRRQEPARRGGWTMPNVTPCV